MPTISVSLKQVNEATTAAQIRNHAIDIDRPEAKGGHDKGAMGGELLLASLGGCFNSNLLAAIRARDLGDQRYQPSRSAANWLRHPPAFRRSTWSSHPTTRTAPRLRSWSSCRSAPASSPTRSKARWISRSPSASSASAHFRIRQAASRQDRYRPAAPARCHRSRDQCAQNEVLLQLRRDTDTWAPPSGGVEPGETVADCALREVFEEAGIEVVPEHVVAVLSGAEYLITYPNGDRMSTVTTVFRCRPTADELPRVNDDESLDVRYFPTDALPDNMLPRHRWIIALALATNTDPYFDPPSA